MTLSSFKSSKYIKDMNGTVKKIQGLLKEAWGLTETLRCEEQEPQPPAVVPYTPMEKQKFLQKFGYYRNPAYANIDDVWGEGSAKAERDFAKANGMSVANYGYSEPNFIKNYFLSFGQYYDDVFEKKQIVLHHTAGGPSAQGTANYWNANSEKVATDFVIGRDGTILRVIPKGYWAWHLGVGRADLDSRAVGIELCAYGYLTLKDGKYWNDYGGEIDKSQVTDLGAKGFKGRRFYESYTEAQIDSLKKLLQYLQKEYNIPFQYSDNIFAYSPRAMAGASGIYTHNSYVTSKSDIFPDSKMITMLQQL